jgi:NADH:ubiquinone oxidoreductase subunit F (NADH-binding)/NADH:ubiquinone oxidoreductase subunit E
MIVQELHKIQERCGYLPEAEMRELAKRLNEPLYKLHAVASFYPLYRLKPPPTVDIKVCRDMTCHLHGAPRLQRSLEALAHELGADGQVEVGGVSCLGQCDRPLAVSINDNVYRGLGEGELRHRIKLAASREELPHQHAPAYKPTWKIDPYNGERRYEGLRRFIETRNGDAVLKELEEAQLRGMGGAGFPTHLKWKSVRKEPGDVKYVVCNADESEPGTFKDRELMRVLPHLLVEGITLAGLITGAKEGWIYIRHEYHEEAEAMRAAIREAQSQGLCGENVLGSGMTFKLDVFMSPGGYVQGEESALLEAMEDRRGEPRNKPPFPTVHGLFSKPTVINNVETLSWVPAILKRGGKWYHDGGVRGAPGMRFVSISGDVSKPGVYEVPFGQTVRELVMETAGGMRDGQRLKGIAPSGPSGGFLPALLNTANLTEAQAKFVKEKVSNGAATLDILDLPLSLQVLGGIGSMLGAAFVVAGDKSCMVDMALNTTQFFRNESCGKCVPCRMGSQKMSEILSEIATGRFSKENLGVVKDLAQTMYLTSICGLGQVAATPMQMLMTHFRDELNAHIERGQCPAGVCIAR